MWFTEKFEDILRKHLKLELINDEMIKQLRSYEGNYPFIYNLGVFTSPTTLKDQYEFVADKKQLNFLVRMFLKFHSFANENAINLLTLRHACVTGLKANVSTKDIEAKLDSIINKV